MADRTVILTLQVKLYDEQRREGQDGRSAFLFLGMETRSYSIRYRCFDNVDHIWHHIGRSFCRGSLLRDIASEIQSMAPSMCASIQRLVHASRPSPDGPDGEPIRVTWILQRVDYFPGDGEVGVGESEPARDVPASESLVRSLKRRRAADDDGGEGRKKVCVICQEEFGKEGSLVALPCDHEFHEKCIIGWLQRAHSCPLCRFLLPVDSSHEHRIYV